MKCCQSECRNVAMFRITWGERLGQRGVFCESCMWELWSKAKGLVELGKLFWIQEPVVAKELS